MSQPNDSFVKFAVKIRQVLECPDREVVLGALRDQLALGKAVSVSSALVDSLSGLGQESRDVVNTDYQETMMTLLVWGLRRFPVSPSLNAKDLWIAMSIFDGPSGFNQKSVG
jgi:hypothetical protein